MFIRLCAKSLQICCYCTNYYIGMPMFNKSLTFALHSALLLQLCCYRGQILFGFYQISVKWTI